MKMKYSLPAIIFLAASLAFSSCDIIDDGGDTPASPASSLFVSKSPIEPGDICPNGGVQIDMGFDNNGNNVLDAEEITNTEYVCNGEDGQDSNAHPFVVYMRPAHHDDDVAPDSVISVVFNTDMDPDTINDTTFTVVDELGNPASGTITYNNCVAFFTPTEPLTGINYTVTLSSDIANTQGVEMGYDHIIVFSTYRNLTLEINSLVENPTAEDLIPITFTFNKNVIEFSESNVDVINGSINNFVKISASEYSADLIPQSNGEIVVSVPAGAVFDFEGNESLAAEFIIYYDITPPAEIPISITRAGAGSITLEWTEPAEPDFDHVIITWEPGGTTGIIVPAGTTSMQIDSLTNGTTYVFNIITVDVLGNESGEQQVSMELPEISAPVHMAIVPEDAPNFIAAITNPSNSSHHFVLGIDIDLSAYSSGEGWTPIPALAGCFQGNGHIIRNITINRPNAYAAFIAGLMPTGVISNLRLVNVNIIGGGSYTYIGTLVGTNQGTIIDCSVTGTIATSSNLVIGGLCGNNSGIITDSHAGVTVTATYDGHYYAGGFVGSNSGEIFDSYATGTVTGVQSAGGFIGQNNTGSSVTGCHATGTVYGTRATGGFIGSNFGDMTDCYSGGSVYGTVDVAGSKDAIGGLAGKSDGNVINCHATGAVTGSGFGTGGLIGYASTVVSCCYATGSVSGVNATGGLIGCTPTGGNTCTVSDSYARGNVTGTGNYTGGLIGSNGNNCSILRCYETGTVTGSTSTGGLVGYMYGAYTLTSCYYNNANKNNGYGTAMTLANMRLQATYSGWNFTAVWAISTSLNGGYPYLR